MRKLSWLIPVLAAAALGAEEPPSGSVWEARKSAWEKLAPGQKDEVFRFADGYKSYLSAARSALTSTREVMTEYLRWFNSFVLGDWWRARPVSGAGDGLAPDQAAKRP